MYIVMNVTPVDPGSALLKSLGAKAEYSAK